MLLANIQCTMEWEISKRNAVKWNVRKYPGRQNSHCIYFGICLECWLLIKHFEFHAINRTTTYAHPYSRPLEDCILHLQLNSCMSSLSLSLRVCTAIFLGQCRLYEHERLVAVWSSPSCEHMHCIVQLVCMRISPCIRAIVFKREDFFPHPFDSSFINDRKQIDSNKFIGLRSYDFCNIDVDFFHWAPISIASFQVWIKILYDTCVCRIYCEFFLCCFSTLKNLLMTFNQCVWCTF